MAAQYDSDSSADETGDIETNVLLGYASQEPTGDDFSQLGGRPIWLDHKTAPSGALARCKVCSSVMSLLLQLNADLPDWFPGHERRLYVFGCRRKSCRRRSGSVRAIRAVRASEVETGSHTSAKETRSTSNTAPAKSLGETLFGVKAPTSTQTNPFASNSTASSSAASPFSSQPATSTVPAISTSTKPADDLAQTFAEKVRISSPPSQPSPPSEPWQDDPSPYPAYYLDAEKEYLELEAQPVPSNARLETDEGTTTAAEEKALFESTMDKTFQRFADTVNQNPEQVLRYEFTARPLLYSKDDAVGKVFSQSPARIPRCDKCGAARVFELQLTPQAITELEKEEDGMDGMDWGTIIVGVCSADCVAQGEIGHFDEWVGVQWE